MSAWLNAGLIGIAILGAIGGAVYATVKPE